MTLYGNNPNLACQIILPADYCSIGWTQPTSQKPDLTTKKVNESAKRKVLEQMGCDFIGITETPQRKQTKTGGSPLYCPTRERILNDQ